MEKTNLIYAINPDTVKDSAWLKEWSTILEKESYSPKTYVILTTLSTLLPAGLKPAQRRSKHTADHTLRFAQQTREMTTEITLSDTAPKLKRILSKMISAVELREFITPSEEFRQKLLISTFLEAVMHFLDIQKSFLEDDPKTFFEKARIKYAQEIQRKTDTELLILKRNLKSAWNEFMLNNWHGFGTLTTYGTKNNWEAQTSFRLKTAINLQKMLYSIFSTWPTVESLANPDYNFFLKVVYDIFTRPIQDKEIYERQEDLKHYIFGYTADEVKNKHGLDELIERIDLP